MTLGELPIGACFVFLPIIEGSKRQYTKQSDDSIQDNDGKSYQLSDYQRSLSVNAFYLPIKFQSRWLWSQYPRKKRPKPLT